MTTHAVFKEIIIIIIGYYYWHYYWSSRTYIHGLWRQAAITLHLVWRRETLDGKETRRLILSLYSNWLPSSISRNDNSAGMQFVFTTASTKQQCSPAQSTNINTRSEVSAAVKIHIVILQSIRSSSLIGGYQRGTHCLHHPEYNFCSWFSIKKYTRGSWL